MDARTFERLVENIRIDGALTGSVTCYQPSSDAPIEILSGHHRTAAAIEAGLEAIDAIVITTPLDEQRKVAIQLSHNAITGQDDRSLLASLYADLDLDAKKFSGLDDAVLGDLQSIDIASLSVGSTQYQQIALAFLPEEAAEFDRRIKELGRSSKIIAHVGRYEDFDKFFDAVIRTKKLTSIQNSAIAISAMAELALMKLNEMEQAAQKPPEATP